MWSYCQARMLGRWDLYTVFYLGYLRYPQCRNSLSGHIPFHTEQNLCFKPLVIFWSTLSWWHSIPVPFTEADSFPASVCAPNAQIEGFISTHRLGPTYICPLALKVTSKAVCHSVEKKSPILHLKHEVISWRWPFIYQKQFHSDFSFISLHLKRQEQ